MLSLARKARYRAKEAARQIEFRLGWSAFQRSLRSGRTPRLSVLEQLARGWGNQAWCASAGFLEAMLEWLPKTHASILECGSGLSTLLLAAGASTGAREVHSLEHDPDWAAYTTRRLPQRLRERVSVCNAPLRSYGDFDWYSIDPGVIPQPIGYVVCDGPPSITRGGRYGLGPVLRSYFQPGCVILLDDTQRDGERAIVARWQAELGATVIQEGETFTVLRVGSPNPAI